ncbi:uncharacterized protein LOC126973049 [Leptidea sinapis]|uniref:uncharacterized protein LOC126973049 n=1 Tax=Leptidea sinapis TaxID=189913 RepID=UPI0021C4AAEA|nr:uncharacterized protein LOC126973049 [Leptidea sinapis]
MREAGGQRSGFSILCGIDIVIVLIINYFILGAPLSELYYPKLSYFDILLILVLFNFTVDELQKKWKHLRDYYVKEKKQDNTRSGSAAPKKRKNSYFELLRFLDVVKDSRASSGNISALAGDDDQNENSCDEISTNTNTQPRNANAQETVTENFVPPQTEVSGTMNKKQQSPKTAEEDADTKFLLSLLPQIKSLNERQNFEFRIEVMNLIYKHTQWRN